ncbi:MAG: class I SAM-dependent methyltransferase, partial [Acidobacteria bacterium]|nr:class I SAM-dependent methyltransferase [Acidobacteriota bacterium]
ELASILEIGRSLVRGGRLIVKNNESIGLHYAKTLSLWRERFFRQLANVRQLGFDERFTRMWDFYLAWCEGGFREQYIDSAQLVIGKRTTQKRAPAGVAMPKPSAVRA